MTIGTQQCNRRGMPYDLRTLKLKKGETSHRRQADMVAVKWQDNREVKCTTQHKLMLCRQGQPLETRNKQVVVHDYMSNMCGVDNRDQLLVYMPINCRSPTNVTIRIYFTSKPLSSPNCHLPCLLSSII